MYVAAQAFLAAQDYLVGLAPFLIGLVIVAALIFAVAYGIRVRKRGDQRPSGPQPPQPSDPVGYETDRREATELRPDGRRHLPHEMDSGSEAAQESQPAKWNEGSSGGFGSGGPGHT